jgi:hypothetical protein
MIGPRDLESASPVAEFRVFSLSYFGALQAGGDHVPEGSATNSGCARDRERSENSPLFPVKNFAELCFPASS